ncbi:MAG: ABC transporter substrate-binding protein [Chloroflexi bacterium]|nr:ABC transporter substrate-binding protein [Chloroflexota bacterium]
MKRFAHVVPSHPLTILALALAASLAACQPAAPTAVPSTLPPASPTATPAPQALTIGLGRNLYEGATSWYIVHGSLGVWEPLVILDNEMRAVPVLATSWEANDQGTVWTFRLRQGVLFHDGTPFNADAVLLNVPKLQEEYDRSLPHLDRLEKVDDHTVQFHLSRPTPNLPQLIAYFSSAMLSPASLGSDGRPGAPIGTGPFRFVQHVKDDSIVLERNDSYWGNPPRLEQVTFKYIPDATTRLAALQTGEIDAVADVGALQPEQASVVEANPDLRLHQQGVATTHYLTFNSGKPPFQDPRLRRAVSLALDRHSLLDNALAGYGIPGVSVITPLAAAWVRADVAPQHDPTAAKALAGEALGSQRVAARLVLSSALLGRWPYENISQILQAAVSDLGIDVEIVTLEAGAWNDALKSGDYNITMMPYTLMTGDPDFFMSNWVWSQGSLNQRRSYGYANPHADDLVLAARSEMDVVKRKAQYDELQALIADEVPFTPLYHETTLYATRSDVADLTLDIQFKPSIERAYRTAQ